MKKWSRLRDYEVLDSGYIEKWYISFKWNEQKEWLLNKYQPKYPEYELKIVRGRTDTLGLRVYFVCGKKKEVK